MYYILLDRKNKLHEDHWNFFEVRYGRCEGAPKNKELSITYFPCFLHLVLWFCILLPIRRGCLCAFRSACRNYHNIINQRPEGLNFVLRNESFVYILSFTNGKHSVDKYLAGSFNVCHFSVLMWLLSVTQKNLEKNKQLSSSVIAHHVLLRTWLPTWRSLISFLSR